MSDWRDTTKASIADDNDSEEHVSICNRLFCWYSLGIGRTSCSRTLLFSDNTNESIPEAHDSSGDSSIIGHKLVRQCAIVKYKSMVWSQWATNDAAILIGRMFDK